MNKQKDATVRTLADTGKITIPKNMRTKLGWLEGDQLLVEMQDDKLIVSLYKKSTEEE